MVRTVRVLVVDDDPDFLDHARGALCGIGELRSTSNPDLALREIPIWEPDVILLDLMLEGVDAFAFLDLLITLVPDGAPSVLCMIDGPGAGTRLLPVDGWPVGTLLRSSSHMQFRIAVLKAASVVKAIRESTTPRAG